VEATATAPRDGSASQSVPSVSQPARGSWCSEARGKIRELNLTEAIYVTAVSSSCDVRGGNGTFLCTHRRRSQGQRLAWLTVPPPRAPCSLCAHCAIGKAVALHPSLSLPLPVLRSSEHRRTLAAELAGHWPREEREKEELQGGAKRCAKPATRQLARGATRSLSPLVEFGGKLEWKVGAERVGKTMETKDDRRKQWMEEDSAEGGARSACVHEQ
jgi:hypothetical protein